MGHGGKTLHKWGLPTLRFPTALDQCQETGARLMLVLARVPWLGEYEDSVGHVIPGIVDADEQE